LAHGVSLHSSISNVYVIRFHIVGPEVV